jgi:hypothetical protein
MSGLKIIRDTCGPWLAPVFPPITRAIGGFDKKFCQYTESGPAWFVPLWPRGAPVVLPWCSYGAPGLPVVLPCRGVALVHWAAARPGPYGFVPVVILWCSRDAPGLPVDVPVRGCGPAGSVPLRPRGPPVVIPWCSRWPPWCSRSRGAPIGFCGAPVVLPQPVVLPWCSRGAPVGPLVL